MLILQRRPSESIMIGSEVTVTVLAVKGNQVRIGIAAPRHLRVDREELRKKILQEQQDQADADRDNQDDQPCCF